LGAIDAGDFSRAHGLRKFRSVTTILPAMLLGVPVVKFAQAMGPFNDPINRMAARMFLTRCARVFGRGEQTMKHLQAVGFPPERFSRAADMAFLLEDRDALSCISAAYAEELVDKVRTLKTSTRFILGVCPSSVLYKKHGDVYVKRLAHFVADQVAAGGCDPPLSQRHAGRLPQQALQQRSPADQEDPLCLAVRL
jgi:colanic acid/amylovoran biosynthesis protein